MWIHKTESVHYWPLLKQHRWKGSVPFQRQAEQSRYMWTKHRIPCCCFCPGWWGRCRCEEPERHPEQQGRNVCTGTAGMTLWWTPARGTPAQNSKSPHLNNFQQSSDWLSRHLKRRALTAIFFHTNTVQEQSCHLLTLVGNYRIISNVIILSIVGTFLLVLLNMRNMICSWFSRHPYVFFLSFSFKKRRVYLFL